MVATVKIVRKQHKPGLLERIQRSLSGPKQVKVGFPAGESSAGNIQKAIYNEFGTKGSGKGFKTDRGGGFGGPIPERPFMRNAMKDNRGKYHDEMAKAAKKIITGDLDMVMALRGLGVIAQGDIRDEITSLSTPPNSPLTVALKGSSNPLIDSREMHASVSWKIDE